MPVPKKGALAQITFVMVDPLDFATIRSGLTAMPTGSYFGVLQGVSTAATHGAISRTISHVRSGLYRAVLKSTENNYDLMTAEFYHASAATQVIQWWTEPNNIASLLSDTQSKIIVMSGILSDAYSAMVALSDAVSNVYSAALLTQSLASDAASGVTVLLARTATMVSDLSDILSGVTAIQGASEASDIASAVWAHAIGVRVDSRILVLQSAISDVDSALTSQFVNQSNFLSNISDIVSNAYSAAAQANSRILLTQSMASIAAAAASNANSLLIAGVPATLTASDMSDIVSRVWSAKYTGHSVASSFGSLFSDVFSRMILTQAAATAGASRALLIQSTVSNIFELASDIDSALTSQFTYTSNILSYLSNLESNLSGIGSDILSAVRGNSDALSDVLSRLNSASFLSDVASHVWAAKYTGNSAASSFGSMLSDMLSRVVLTQTAATAGASRALLVQSTVSNIFELASDIDSALTSQFVNQSNFLSNISDIVSNAYSAAVQASSRILVTQSMASIAAAAASNANSLLIAGVPATLGVSDISNVARQVWREHYAAHQGVSTFGSLFSNFYSVFQGRVPKLVATNSQLSDLVSDLRSLLVTTGVLLDASTMSDLRSAITAGAGAVTVSNISDIVSAMRADLASDLSDLLSRTTQINSRVLLTQSTASDAASGATILQSRTLRLMSDLSDLLSGVTALQGASYLSDLVSAVWAAKYTTNSAASSFGSLFSDLYSRAVLIQSGASDAASGATILQSRTLRLMSDLSDALSALSVLQAGVNLTASGVSDVGSRVWGYPLASRIAMLSASDLSDLRSAITGITVTIDASAASDIASAVWGHAVGIRVDSRLLVLQSLASDIDSALTSRFSDLLSLLNTTGIQLNASTLSDLRSAIQGVTVNLTVSDISDIASAVAAAVTTVSVSNISDIASAVRAALVSDLSDILSAAQQVNSRALLLQSLVSDVDSALTSRFSDLLSLLTTTGVQVNASSLSDLRSAIAAVAVTIDASAASDIASAVWAHTVGTRVDSRLLVAQSFLSDLYSLASDLNSDLRSLITLTGVQLNASSFSDLRSAITAATVTIDASAASDIASAVWAHTIGARVDSRVLLSRSDLSDLMSRTVTYLSDMSDVLSRTTQLNSRVLLAGSAASDAASGMTVTLSRTLRLMSDLSDVLSGITALQAGVNLTVSSISDVGSRVWGYPLASRIAMLSASDLSDIRSAIQGVTVNLTVSDISDIASAVAAAVTTITASDISDIASAVRAVLVSDLSDLLSRATQINSRVLLAQSAASDATSGVTMLQSRTARLMSDLSDVLSGITVLQAGVNLTVSSISDVGSRVWGYPLASRVAMLSPSDLSDLRSAIAAAAVTLDASALSDIASAVWANAIGARVDSRVRLVQSDVSDIYSLLGTVGSAVSDLDSSLSDLQNDFQSRVPGVVLTRATTMAELASAPPATPTMEQALMLMFQRERNNTKMTMTTRKIRNAAGTTIASAVIAKDVDSLVQGTLA